MAATKYLDQEGLSLLWSKIKEQDALYEQVYGYYLNNKFYKDSTYTVEIPTSKKHIYIDNNSGDIYYFNGILYRRAVQQADGSVPGILKLYTTSGQNTDGTMTQKAITDGVQAISFAIDSTESECLVLNLPWN